MGVGSVVFYFGSGETDKNRFGSPPIHESRPIHEEATLQGLSGAWRGGSCCEFCSPIRRGGVPSGVVAIIVPDGERGNNPHSISEYYDFQGNCSITISTLTGFHPAVLCSPRMRLRLNRYYVIIAEALGGLGGQARSPPSSYECLYFISRGKGILKSQNIRFFRIIPKHSIDPQAQQRLPNMHRSPRVRMRQGDFMYDRPVT
jgi:hypothetical protein